MAASEQYKQTSKEQTFTEILLHSSPVLGTGVKQRTKTWSIFSKRFQTSKETGQVNGQFYPPHGASHMKALLQKNAKVNSPKRVKSNPSLFNSNMPATALCEHSSKKGKIPMRETKAQLIRQVAKPGEVCKVREGRGWRRQKQTENVLFITFLLYMMKMELCKSCQILKTVAGVDDASVRNSLRWHYIQMMFFHHISIRS